MDRFEWSKRLQGADDYRSIDLNPWENPYVTHDGTYPNSWWLSRSRPRYAWRSSDHPVVRAFSAHGFSWGGSYRDYHHFQG